MTIRGDTAQLGLDALLVEAEAANRVHALERRTAHLPATMEGALPSFRQLLEKHHAAMLAADVETVMRLREVAHDLVLRLKHGAPGILAGPLLAAGSSGTPPQRRARPLFGASAATS